MARYDYGWRPYVSAAKRRRRAEREIARLRKSGHAVRPVEIDGRVIARTFWGRAWCDNLEAYSDYANRLPRGRTYVRNGSVLDLQLEPGRVRALVNGSSLYRVEVGVRALEAAKWREIRARCAGKIDSMVELLQGSISKGVMEIVSRPGEGLFPGPDEITLACSCPDWADMCKHVAAVLYGVGARLDDEPEMLFPLRGVDPSELIAVAITQGPALGKPRRGRALRDADLSSVFGIELDPGDAAPEAPRKTKRRRSGDDDALGAPAESKTRRARSAPGKRSRTGREKAASKRSAAKPKEASAKRGATQKAPAKRAATKASKATAKRPSQKANEASAKRAPAKASKATAKRPSQKANEASAKRAPAKGRAGTRRQPDGDPAA